MNSFSRFLTLFLLSSLALLLPAQNKSVTGNVTDALGEPIIGATVQVKGSTSGTITDLDGNFAISADPGDDDRGSQRLREHDHG